MLKMDKQVNRNTLIAVAIPFLINIFIDIFSRTSYYQKLKDKFLPENNQSDKIKNPVVSLVPHKNALHGINNSKRPLNPELEEFMKKHNINSNVSFGVSYTTVHLLGKLVNKIRGAGVQTYDVYSACKNLNMPDNEIKEATTLKFLRELTSQLLENIIYFTVLIKLKKKLDKSFAMAVFIPAALSIAIDLVSRSKAFDFLKKWSKNLFEKKPVLESKQLQPEAKRLDYLNSSLAFKAFLEKQNAVIPSNKT